MSKRIISPLSISTHLLLFLPLPLFACSYSLTFILGSAAHGGKQSGAKGHQTHEQQQTGGGEEEEEAARRERERRMEHKTGGSGTRKGGELEQMRDESEQNRENQRRNW